MQNREELRQKGCRTNKKTMWERGKNIIFGKGGGGLNIVSGPKNRQTLTVTLPTSAYVYRLTS
jgi:hypothetical protein